MTCFIDCIFLPLWAIADSDFSPLEIYKNITFPCLLSLLQSTATQITVSVNIFVSNICFTEWNRFIFRSSRLEVFCRKGILRNFTEFTEKHLCQRLLFNKVAGLRPATLLKKALWHRCTEHLFYRTPALRWLLLYIQISFKFVQILI